MAEVRQTVAFSGWLHRLRNANAVALLVAFAAWRWGIPATLEALVRASKKCASTTGRDTGSTMCIAVRRL
jgi:hypothetical protein